MPSSNPKIIRGMAAADLPSWSIDPVGSQFNNKVDRLLQELSGHFGDHPTRKPVVLTPEQQALMERKRELDEREARIAALEQQTLREAEEKGTQRGYEAGWDAAHQERHALVGMAESLNQQFEAFKTSLADKVLDLAIEVSKKVIGDTVELQTEYATRLLEDMVHSMRLNADEVSLSAHPETLKVLEAQIGDTRELAKIKLVSDPRQLNGGFILHHPEGEIDASMQTRWLRVVEQLGKNEPLTPDEV